MIKDNLSNVSTDCTFLIGDYLGNTSPLVGTSRRFHGLFQTHCTSTALLSYVVKGMRDKASEMPHTKLLLCKKTVTDYAGRRFKNITAYQYALWAFDLATVRMIEEKACHEMGPVGDVIRANLLNQRKELKEKGITYTLKGEEYCETEYNPTALFDAYQTFIDNHDAQMAAKEFKELNNALLAIGAQQRLMPMNVLQAMCSLEGDDFSPNPLGPFNESPPLEPSIKGYNEKTVAKFIDGLGIHFAICRVRNVFLSSESHGSTSGSYYSSGLKFHDSVHKTSEGEFDKSGSQSDLDSLKNLFTARAKELMQDPTLIPREAGSYFCVIS